MANLFWDDGKTDTIKRVSDLSSKGYSPTKKKEGAACAALALVLVMHLIHGMMMPVLILKWRMRITHPVRPTSSFEQLRIHRLGI
jgi:hypothetical protein